MTNDNEPYNNIMKFMHYDKNTEDILNYLIILKNKIDDKDKFMTKLNGDYIGNKNIIDNKKLKWHSNNILKYLQSSELNKTIKKYDKKIIINSIVRKKYYESMIKHNSIKLTDCIKSINSIDIYNNMLIFTDAIYHYIIDVDYNNLNNFALITPLSFMFTNDVDSNFIDCLTLSFFDDRYKNYNSIKVSSFKINKNNKYIYSANFKTNEYTHDFSFVDKCLIPEIYMILHTLDKINNRKTILKKSPAKRKKRNRKAKSYNSWKKEYLEEKPQYIDSAKTDITWEYKHSFEVSKHHRTYRYCKACNGFIKKADRYQMKCPRCHEYLKIKIKRVEIDSYVKNEELPRKHNNIIIDTKEDII